MENNRAIALKHIAETLHRIAPDAEHILYGSEARGEARADSDIDILILMDGDNLTQQQEDHITTPLYEIELMTGTAISPLVMLKKQCYGRKIKTPFFINVMNEGIRI